MIFHQPLNSLTNHNYNIALYRDTTWEDHFHRNLEVICVLKGSVKCTVNNVDCVLSEGDFGLCLPCDIHRYEPCEDTLYWVIVFSEDFVQMFAKITEGKVGKKFSFNLSEEVKQYVYCRLVKNEDPSLFTLKSCLYAICEEYLKSVKLINKKRSELELFTLISDFIHEHYTGKITLRDVAVKIGYDYNYTSRYFHRTFNMKFNDYVNICRLERATELLDNTKKSITEIAFESGFQSVRSFNDYFRKRMNISPQEYRKNQGAGSFRVQ